MALQVTGSLDVTGSISINGEAVTPGGGGSTVYDTYTGFESPTITHTFTNSGNAFTYHLSGSSGNNILRLKDAPLAPTQGSEVIDIIMYPEEWANGTVHGVYTEMEDVDAGTGIVFSFRVGVYCSDSQYPWYCYNSTGYFNDTYNQQRVSYGWGAVQWYFASGVQCHFVKSASGLVLSAYAPYQLTGYRGYKQLGSAMW